MTVTGATPTTAGSYTIYLNGVSKGTGQVGAAGTAAPLLFDGTHDIAVGNSGRDAADVEFFNGLLDDVRIYNTALTPSEVQQTMVPEPAAAAAAGLGLLACRRGRRRRE